VDEVVHLLVVLVLGLLLTGVATTVATAPAQANGSPVAWVIAPPPDWVFSVSNCTDGSAPLPFNFVTVLRQNGSNCWQIEIEAWFGNLSYIWHMSNVRNATFDTGGQWPGLQSGTNQTARAVNFEMYSDVAIVNLTLVEVPELTELDVNAAPANFSYNGTTLTALIPDIPFTGSSPTILTLFFPAPPAPAPTPGFQLDVFSGGLVLCGAILILLVFMLRIYGFGIGMRGGEEPVPGPGLAAPPKKTPEAKAIEARLNRLEGATAALDRAIGLDQVDKTLKPLQQRAQGGGAKGAKGGAMASLSSRADRALGLDQVDRALARFKRKSKPTKSGAKAPSRMEQLAHATDPLEKAIGLDQVDKTLSGALGRLKPKPTPSNRGRSPPPPRASPAPDRLARRAKPAESEPAETKPRRARSGGEEEA
jgi:hypothetical protein